MSERVTFIEHKGKEILYLDLSDCPSEVYLETIEQAKGVDKTNIFERII